MLRYLQAQRQQTEDKIGQRPIGVAACAVLDELIRRTRVLAAAVPADAPLTLAVINNHFSDLAATLAFISTTLRKMADLEMEGGNAVEVRRQPLLRFVARVRADGYEVADDFTVTDTIDWAALDGGSVASVEVQHAAERIARAEQATIYQQRIERMAREVAETEYGYAQRIRDLIDEIG